MEDINQIMLAIERYGIPMTITGLCLWLVVWYGPRLIKAHLAFLAKMQETSTIHASTSERNAETYEKLSDTMGVLTNSVGTKLDPRGDPKYNDHIFSNVATNAAIKQGVIGAIKAIESGDATKAVPHLQEALKELE